jgi:hypothetical protein
VWAVACSATAVAARFAGGRGGLVPQAALAPGTVAKDTRVVAHRGGGGAWWEGSRASLAHVEYI